MKFGKIVEWNNVTKQGKILRNDGQLCSFGAIPGPMGYNSSFKFNLQQRWPSLGDCVTLLYADEVLYSVTFTFVNKQ